MDVYGYNNTDLYLVSTTALNISSISPRYPLSPLSYYRVTYHLPASLCFCFQQLAPASLCRGLTLAARSCHALPHRKLRGPGSFCRLQTRCRGGHTPSHVLPGLPDLLPASLVRTPHHLPSLMQSFQHALHSPAPYTYVSLCGKQCLPTPTHQPANSDSFLRSQLKIKSSRKFSLSPEFRNATDAVPECFPLPGQIHLFINFLVC